MTPVRIAQVGGRGFGRVHLQRVDRLAAMGRCVLVGLADPAGPLPDRTAPNGGPLPWFASLPELLAAMPVDIVSIATPIGTHLALALAALRAGADVLLEKPPVTSLTEFQTLVDEQQRTGRAVQVGFQSLGGAGVPAMRSYLADGVLGDDPELHARGCWVRDRAYYERASWAGKRMMNGRRVADGVTTNPLAHAIQTALAIQGTVDVDRVASITTELYHAHDIEADDTSFVRVVPTVGQPINVALTLCGSEPTDPTVELVGRRARARLWYTQDRIDFIKGDDKTTTQYGRVDLLENLLDHRERGVALVSPLAASGAFMAVLEATQDRPEPVAIDPRYVTWVGHGSAAHPIIDGIEHWLDAALASGDGFVGSGAPWGCSTAIASWTPPH